MNWNSFTIWMSVFVVFHWVESVSSFSPEKFDGTIFILFIANLLLILDEPPQRQITFASLISFFVMSWGGAVAAAALAAILNVLLLFIHTGRRSLFLWHLKADETTCMHLSTCKRIRCPFQVWKNCIPVTSGTVEKRGHHEKQSFIYCLSVQCIYGYIILC